MTVEAELYRFVETNGGAITTYTSSDESIDYDAGDGVETYEPVHIVRNQIEQRRELQRANLEILLPHDDAAASIWAQNLGELFLTLTIFRRNTSNNVSTIWKGRLSGIVPDMDRINMNMESVFTSLKRTGVRARYQRSCRHTLYGRGCNVDPADHAWSGDITAQPSARVVTVPGSGSVGDPDHFRGGMLLDPSNVYSFITEVSGNNLTLQRLPYSLETAIAAGFPVAVTLYPGCARSRLACDTKFNNRLNYGGFDWIPNKNPSGGSSII